MNCKLHLSITLVFLLVLTISGLSTAQEIDPYSSSNDAFTIKVDLPQAVVHDLSVTDTLPQGLIYKSDSLEVIGIEGSPSETVSSPNDGSQPVFVTWFFDPVDNSHDEDFIIRFQPIVADVSSNTDGETLAESRVSLQFTDDFGEIYTAAGEIASVKLVEPDLEMAMSCSPDGGKTVTCSASIGHASGSHADAFGTDLSILLPAGITYSPGSVEVVSAPTGALDDSNPQELKMHFDGIDRSWNKDHMILLKFQATREDGAAPDASFGEIKADITWKSAPGDNPGTRSYNKTQSIPISEYVPSYSLSINSVAEPDPVEAGQSLLYTISYANTGPDDVHGLTIEETYDQNVTYLSAIPMPDVDKEDLWTIGELKAGASGTIKLVVRVNPDSGDGTMLKNLAKMSCGEYATAEAITETIVRGKPDKLTTKASSNSTNSSLMENENETASQDILQNGTENATAAIISINDTKVDLVYLNLDNATETTNTTTSINQSDALVNLTAEAEDPKTAAGNQSETGGDLPGGAAIQLNETAGKSSETLDETKAVEQVEQNVESGVYARADPVPINQDNATELTDTDSLAEAGGQLEAGGDLPQEAANQNEIADESSETMDQEKAFEQLELNVKNDVYTISFGDGTKVDIVFDKSNPMMETPYVVLNETGEVSNVGGDSSTTGQKEGAASTNTTSNSQLETDQTDIVINKTEEIEILPGNESEKRIDLPIVSDNEPAVSADPVVTTDDASDEPEKSFLPEDSGPHQATIQPADEENLPVETQSQPTSEDNSQAEPQLQPTTEESAAENSQDTSQSQPADEGDSESVSSDPIDYPV